MKTQGQTVALGALHSDYGPSIRRQAIRALDGAVLREPDVEKHEGPDPDHPDRQFNVSRGIRWLPLKLLKSGAIDDALLKTADTYRDLMDVAAGVLRMDGLMPSSRGGIRVAGITDVQLDAARALEKADRAMGRETTRAIRLAVNADTASEVALGCGIAHRRVPVVVRSALTDLMRFWDRHGESAY